MQIFDRWLRLSVVLCVSCILGCFGNPGGGVVENCLKRCLKGGGGGTDTPGGVDLGKCK